MKGPESIADHMYRMGIMALVAPDIPGIDRDRFLFSLFLFFLQEKSLSLLRDSSILVKLLICSSFDCFICD